jgi:hypothetical protein
MTLYHYPIPIPEDYSPEQVIAILHLLETLHNAIQDVYALKLREIVHAQLHDNDDDRQYDIPF